MVTLVSVVVASTFLGRPALISLAAFASSFWKLGLPKKTCWISLGIAMMMTIASTIFTSFFKGPPDGSKA